MFLTENARHIRGNEEWNATQSHETKYPAQFTGHKNKLCYFCALTQIN